jgi:cysteine desulfurase
MPQTIYLDYNATTPIANEVAEAMLPYLYGRFGNPSSGHPYGLAGKDAVDHARAQVAGLLGCQTSEVVFTSGGTESNNYALKGTAFARRGQGDQIITSSVEHPAITEVCAWLQDQGYRIAVLPVDQDGLVDPADLEEAISSRTLLVSVMQANNEVGSIQPIARLAEIAHRYGALMHTDAAQALGKIPVRVADLGVDLLSIAGHKLYAPKGIGALYVRAGVELVPLLHGAGHEDGRRPGTENVLEIVGLGQACEMAERDLERNMAHFLAMRDRLYAGLVSTLGRDAVRVNGHPEKRLPNTLSVSFYGVEANTLLAQIGDQVAASAGAACHADEVEVSAVLAAMDIPLEWAMGTVRLSVGRDTTADEVDRAVEVIAVAAHKLQPGETMGNLILQARSGDDGGSTTRSKEPS